MNYLNYTKRHVQEPGAHESYSEVISPSPQLLRLMDDEREAVAPTHHGLRVQLKYSEDNMH